MLVHELQPAPRAEDVFFRLARLPHCLFLDSAMRHETLGRYSFVAADPFDWITVPADGTDGFDRLAKRLASFATPSEPDLPPFQGGAAGLFGYDLCRSVERIASPRHDEFKVPAMAVGLYDLVFAFDHEQDRAWILSHGFPETKPSPREKRAARRLEEAKSWLQGSLQEGVLDRSSENGAPIDPSRLAPQFSTGMAPELTSDFSKEKYLQAVQKAIDYIYAGDLFQVNLSQRLLHPAVDDSVSLYRRLRERNPAPFSGFLDLGPFQICSASPERFLKVRDSQVETRPIKGTRSRTAQAEANLFAGDDLKQSEKDRAENVMIVDLLRNDLSRVCDADTVFVSQLCGLESYAYVQHLVSVIQGRLRNGLTPLDLLRASFPGGSITGAPKIRAMEIIAELEPTARGAYCGSLGYLGFDASADTSILIRTITAGRGYWQLPVGGGIVAQSRPQDEYEETWHKAEGMIRALR